MSKIPNPHKFILKTIELFIDKSIKSNKPSNPMEMNRFRPSEFYTKGHCAEYAYNLAKYAKSKGIETNVTIMLSDHHEKDTGDFVSKTLSHVIVELDDKSYDVTAWEGDARRDWFIKTQYIDSFNPSVERSWHFVSLSTDDMDNVYNVLKEHCSNHDVPFSDEQLDKDYLIFDSLTKKKSSDLTIDT